MKERINSSCNDQPRPDGRAGGAWEGRAVKFADSYEILEPQEAPDFRSYARVLRKRLSDGLDCLFYFVQHIVIATLKQKPVYRARYCWRFKKKIRTFPPYRNSTNLTASPDAYLRSQYTILGSESWRASVIDQLRLDTLAEFNAPGGGRGPGVKKGMHQRRKCLLLARFAPIGKSISECCSALKTG